MSFAASTTFAFQCSYVEQLVCARGRRGNWEHGKEQTLFRAKLDDSRDRPEDFFFHDLHLGMDVCEDGGLDNISFFKFSFGARAEMCSGSILDSRFDISCHSLQTCEWRTGPILLLLEGKKLTSN